MVPLQDGSAMGPAGQSVRAIGTTLPCDASQVGQSGTDVSWRRSEGTPAMSVRGRTERL
ncbi:hypothetical protein BRAO375_1590059 [Bradyrhizobium sp. ORS 375]|nr:hypothetical protein BRAO375_1590059 [Bradyrhizobium sp. ORS 375]